MRTNLLTNNYGVNKWDLYTLEELKEFLKEGSEYQRRKAKKELKFREGLKIMECKNCELLKGQVQERDGLIERFIANTTYLVTTVLAKDEEIERLRNSDILNSVNRTIKLAKAELAKGIHHTPKSNDSPKYLYQHRDWCESPCSCGLDQALAEYERMDDLLKRAIDKLRVGSTHRYWDKCKFQRQPDCEICKIVADYDKEQKA